MFATPDITKAQLIALAQAILGLVVVFGFSVSPHTRDAILQLCTVIAIVLPLADAVIRHGRSTGSAGK